MKVEIYQRKLRENYFYFRYWIGILLTVSLIYFVNYGRVSGKPAITPFAWMMAAIVITTSSGGIKTGLFTTTLVALYTLYSTKIGFGPNTLTGSYLNAIIGISIFYTTTIILGLIKDKRDKTIVQLIDTRKQLNEEVRDREIKLQEALEKALVIERGNALGQFATGISHDFNNLLQTIMSLSELTLLQVVKDSPEEKAFQDIICQTEMGSRLIQQIMDFSRKSMINETEINLNEFLAEFTQNCQRMIPKNIEILFYDTFEPVILYFDITHLNQILLNLIANAKYVIKSHGRIEVKLHLDKVNHVAVISVSDTGTGIDCDILPHIFEPYYTTKNRSEGTGLGLAQVWGLIQQYHGSIDVISELGQGTEFIIKLPLDHGVLPNLQIKE